MCIVRKTRTSYTLEEDVVVLRETTARSSSVFGGGSAASKFQAWVEIAERVIAQGVEVTGDGLRRHVADLVKRYKRQGPEPAEGRMRWGIPWPKSDDEVERDRLVAEYIKRMDESKKVATAPASRPTAKAAPLKKPTPLGPTPLNPSHRVNAISLTNLTVTPAARTARSEKSVQVHRTPPVPPRAISSAPRVGTKTKSATMKRSQPEQVVINDDGIDFDDTGMWSVDSPSGEESNSTECIKIGLKRRRLEMEERTQNRMLDIQAEQITLQREQLRLQAEAMRSMADSAQAIARALQALQNRLQ